MIVAERYTALLLERREGRIGFHSVKDRQVEVRKAQVTVTTDECIQKSGEGQTKRTRKHVANVQMIDDVSRRDNNAQLIL